MWILLPFLWGVKGDFRGHKRGNGGRVREKRSVPAKMEGCLFLGDTCLHFYSSSKSFSDLPFLSFHSILPFALFPMTTLAAVEGLEKR